MLPVRPFTALTWMLMAALVAIAGLYAGHYLRWGWFPHDDGTFAVTAEHVLHGELPHRDFDDIYTGGLTYVNAAAMRAFGENLVSLRYPVYAVFLVWVAVAFALARRFVSDWVAAVLVLLLIAMSYPNYSAAVPSWYNLFFATFGIWALFRFMESRRLAWVFVAGLWGGLSFLVKVPGLYFVAAALCFLLFWEQDEDTADSRRSRLSYIHAALGLVFVLLVWQTIGWRLKPQFLVPFVLSSAVVIAILLKREFQRRYVPDLRRLLRVLQLTFVLLAGVLLPIAIFLIPYFRSGALHSFIEGVFVLPFRRLSFAAHSPETLDNLVASGALTVLLVYAAKASNARIESKLRVIVPVVMVLLVVGSGYWRPAYHILWSGLTLLIPLTTVVVFEWLNVFKLPSLQEQRIFLLTAFAAVGSLVRFPFATPIYLLYILPVIPLIWIALAASRPHCSRWVLGSIAVAYIAFFVLRVTPSFITNIGIRYQPMAVTELRLPGAGGLKVAPEEAAVYEEIAQLVAEHSHGRVHLRGARLSADLFPHRQTAARSRIVRFLRCRSRGASPTNCYGIGEPPC